MIKARLQHLRGISEQYVKSQLRHIDSLVPKRDVKKAVAKMTDVLLALEKAKARRQS